MAAPAAGSPATDATGDVEAPETAPNPKTPLRAVAAPANTPPVLDPILPQSLFPFVPLVLTVTAVDEDGDPLLFSAQVIDGPDPNTPTVGWTFDVNTGLFTWTPSCATVPGDHTFRFCVTDGLASDCQDVVMTVTAINMPPTAVPGGPYQGVVGVPVEFNGTQSYDFEGPGVLSYEWDFGDGTLGAGAIIQHTYQIPGTYDVKLTVIDDGPCPRSDFAYTTATISVQCEAVLFVCPDVKLVKLSKKKPTCVRIEPVAGCFSLTDIDVSSIRMRFDGKEISPVLKSATVGDAAPCSNGVDDLEVCFDPADIDFLFSSITKKTTVTVPVDGLLFSAGGFGGTVTLTVQP